jgi:hypothetical protein
MSLIRKLALLALALVFLPSLCAADQPKKADSDEQPCTGTVIEVKKDGTLVIELSTGKRDIGTPMPQMNIKTDSKTKYTKTTKNQSGGQTQSQCQSSDVKKGDKVNCKFKGQGKNKKCTNVNINNTSNPGLSNPTRSNSNNPSNPNNPRN